MKTTADLRAHYSTIIVGAGPAGSTLARRLADKEKDILLIDGSPLRGEKVCAGLISPDAQDLLARYDITLPGAVLSSPQIFSVRTIDLATRQARHYRRSYVNVNRAKFDAFLLSLVPDTVDVISALCLRAEREENGFSLLLKTQNGEKKVSCTRLVGADGASSIVRKSLFPNEKIKRYVAIQQSFRAEGEDPYYSCVFDSCTSPSCSWIFFKDGTLVFGGAFENKHPRDAFEEQKAKLVSLGTVSENIFKEPIKTQACTVLRPKLSGGIFNGANGAFLIGEAAGFISPSSLEGISYALASAEALFEAFSRGGSTRQAQRLYKRKTIKLRLKIALKCVKRPFMYNPLLRRLILASGAGSIKIK
ncbi:MAG: FAD-binding protein [Clostridia bacterium]|nr:FAD-binding protein [Clostridia bacterium]